MPQTAPRDNGRTLDAFNDQLRASSAWQTWMRARFGTDPDGATKRAVRLSDRQRKELRQYLAQNGVTLPDGMEVDPAGNVNQNHGFGKQLKKWGPIAAGAAVTAFGIPGLMPGLIGGGGTAAGSTATLGSTFGVPGLGAAGAPGGALYGAAAPTGGGGGFLSGLWGGVKKVGGALNPFRRGDGEGGGFSARDWLDLAMFGGNTVAGLWAANKQAGASDRAAELELEGYREGLAFLREQWEKYNKDYEPFLTAGQGAIGRLSTRMEGAAPPGMPASVQRRLTGPGETYTPGGTHTPMTLGQFGQRPQPVPDGGWNPTTSAPTGPGPRIDPRVLDLSRQPDGVWSPQPVPVGGNQGQWGHITKGGTVPMTIEQSGQTPVVGLPTPQPVSQSGQADMVPLTAPDGSTRTVPAAKVPYYREKWARMLAQPQGAA